jgi:hypothetical protein
MKKVIFAAMMALSCTVLLAEKTLDVTQPDWWISKDKAGRISWGYDDNPCGLSVSGFGDWDGNYWMPCPGR